MHKNMKGDEKVSPRYFGSDIAVILSGYEQYILFLLKSMIISICNSLELYFNMFLTVKDVYQQKYLHY